MNEEHSKDIPLKSVPLYPTDQSRRHRTVQGSRVLAMTDCHTSWWGKGIIVEYSRSSVRMSRHSSPVLDLSQYRLYKLDLPGARRLY